VLLNFLSYIITDTHIWLGSNQAYSELTEFTNKKQQSQGFFAACFLANMRVYLSCQFFGIVPRGCQSVIYEKKIACTRMHSTFKDVC